MLESLICDFSFLKKNRLYLKTGLELQKIDDVQDVSHV